MPEQYGALSFVSQTSQDSPQGSQWDPELLDNWHSFNLQSHSQMSYSASQIDFLWKSPWICPVASSQGSGPIRTSDLRSREERRSRQRVPIIFNPLSFSFLPALFTYGGHSRWKPPSGLGGPQA